MDIISSSPTCVCEAQTQKEPQGLTTIMPFILSSPSQIEKDIPCCGPPAGPAASPHERPGYAICPFVEGFISTPVGFVPCIKTTLSTRDHLSTALVRSNIGRNNYTVAPGLYAVGNPDENATVFVTANYKLSFDHVRKNLKGMDAFIVVLDTRGINVWCASGKKTFGTDELVNRIRITGLSKVVNHRNIILPQLGAVGVSAIQVKKQSGFTVIWGPINATDIPQFMANGMKAEPTMRRLTFNFTERLVLVPVEVSIALKPAIWITLGLAILSGFGPGFFSVTALTDRGFAATMVLISGIIAGAVLTPALLPRLPGTLFSIKGTVAGFVLTFPIALWFARSTGFTGVLGLVLMSTAVSSWLAMNFTGATPFTSPSGVEKEMKRSMPFQITGAIMGLVCWIVSAF
jgi:hypothetical protein